MDSKKFWEILQTCPVVPHLMGLPDLFLEENRSQNQSQPETFGHCLLMAVDELQDLVFVQLQEFDFDIPPVDQVIRSSNKSVEQNISFRIYWHTHEQSPFVYHFAVGRSSLGKSPVQDKEFRTVREAIEAIAELSRPNSPTFVDGIVQDISLGRYSTGGVSGLISEVKRVARGERSYSCILKVCILHKETTPDLILGIHPKSRR